MTGAGSPAERSLRIAMLHPCYWPEETRGSERFIHDLGVRLARKGHRPRLITSHPGAPSESLEDGIEVLRLHRPRGRRLQLGLRDQYLTHVPGTMTALRETDPDLVHAIYPVDALAASRWGRRTGRPLVYTLMGMPRQEWLRRPVWRRIIGRALARADVSVSLSRRAAELTREAFGLTPRVIHLGVDLELFRPVAARAPVPTILCPADLTDARKRGPLLREAFKVLRSSQPDARLVLSRRSASSAPTDEDPGVEYEDLDSQPTLVRAYSEAWITVLISQAEAFGMVLTESLACGTPVLASPGGGANDIVGGDQVGSLVDSQNPEAVASAIAGSMDSGEGVRSACIARAREFSADRCADAYDALYREVL
jgi:teichuronic acid biosynthesis glycosyltransferase TuaC